MLINCDIGERGAEHPVDVELMKWIQIANLACGGHAGDAESVANFRRLAAVNSVQVTAHLSYPDRENFGRVSLALEWSELAASLDDQYALLPDVKWVKFHGALYNDACVNNALAEKLTQWLKQNEIECVLTPSQSALALNCEEQGIRVLSEAFAERAYAYAGERLSLVKRNKDYASIHICDEAVTQSSTIINEGKVLAYFSDQERQWVELEAETICIHSDSELALELAQRLQD